MTELERKMTIEELIDLAKAGYFNNLDKSSCVPFEKIKAEALQNPEVAAEYERLRPEFDKAHKAADSQKKIIPRNSNGKRKFLMDYIPREKNGKNPLYAAVIFAREMMREGHSPDYANGWAARKYKVRKSDVAHYTGQVAGTVSGRRK